MAKKKYKKRKNPTELKIIETQSGKMGNKMMDLARKAMHPGKRVSKSGNVYWETRKNRSDKNKKKGI